jgi:hypothetical protein
MHLDMQTISAVNVTVTAILGGVLSFTWARESESPFVGWWGLALLIQAAGVAVAATSSSAMPKSFSPSARPRSFSAMPSNGKHRVSLPITARNCSGFS